MVMTQGHGINLHVTFALGHLQHVWQISFGD